MTDSNWKDMRFSANGESLLISDNTAILIKGIYRLEYRRAYKGHWCNITDMICLYDRHRLVLASKDGSLRVWDTSRELGDEDEDYDEEVSSTKSVEVAEDHRSRVTGIVFSSDGPSVATASVDTVKVWDARTGKSQRLFETIKGVKSMLLSPEGKMLAVVGAWIFSPNLVMSWDLSTEQQHFLLFQESDRT
jgi:WD40 repeat protein